MARLAPIALIALLAAGAYFYHRAAAQAPDPYAACAKEKTETDKARCRNQIDFALSAGQ